MKINSFFTRIKKNWNTLIRKRVKEYKVDETLPCAETIDIIEDENQVVLIIEIKRYLVPFKDKHNVSLAFVGTSTSSTSSKIGGILHNINDKTYEYKFNVDKSFLKTTKEKEHCNLFLKVGDYKIQIAGGHHHRYLS
jgi:hypothetical protein